MSNEYEVRGSECGVYNGLGQVLGPKQWRLSGTAKNAGPAKINEPRRYGPKTFREQKEQKRLGFVIVNFSFLAAYLLDAFVIAPHAQNWWMYAAIPGITALVVWQTLWQR